MYIDFSFKALIHIIYVFCLSFSYNKCMHIKFYVFFAGFFALMIV